MNISQLTLFAELNDVVEAFDVDPNSQRNVLFTNRRQQGTELRYLLVDNLNWPMTFFEKKNFISAKHSPEVYEPINPMIDNNLLKTFEIEHIRKQEWTFI